eukprot:snap_masked-scaffold427_size174323-processed-gene-0.7 protein:Tk04508 transcript:snap_masked-scaffold427_size174323-processed-gene-0.7-mRNA-1 annotation:"naked cuticle homolog 1"
MFRFFESIDLRPQWNQDEPTTSRADIKSGEVERKCANEEICQDAVAFFDFELEFEAQQRLSNGVVVSDVVRGPEDLKGRRSSPGPSE